MRQGLQGRLIGCFLSLMMLCLSFQGRANHINGIDLGYTHVSGNTYQVTLTVYGNCGSSTFGSLATAVPVICVFNGNTYDTSLNLALSGPGVNVSNVCPRDTDSTTCTSTTYAIAGTKRYIYTGTITLPTTSQYWRFTFNGAMGATAAGRVTTTNLSGAITTIYLCDTLNNLTVSHSSPSLTVIPSPYYCLNNSDNYNPGGVDPDGDSLVYSLTNARTVAGTACAGTVTNVTYAGTYTATAPLSASSFLFNTGSGAIAFTPSLSGTYCVVYNIRKYNGATVVGTCQRELYIAVQTCTVAPPTGAITAATAGTIVDSVQYSVCQNTGAYSFTITTSEPDTFNTISITPIGVPAWATLSIVNNGTAHPIVTFSSNSTLVAPGTYNFSLQYLDNNCPISGSNAIAYYVTIAAPPAVITFPKDSVCVGSTITYSDATTGGTWSSTSTALATIGSTTGIITGVAAGLDTIKYTTSAGGCSRDTVLHVMPVPKAITGTLTACVGSTTTLADSTAGGTWVSATTTVATVGAATGIVTGVATGTTTIDYILPAGRCFASVVVTINAVPGPITSAATTVCVGSTLSLTDATPGGTWTSNNTGLATVGAATGVVTGVAAGTDTISYTSGSGCAVGKAIVVNALPSAITGTPSICLGGTTSLSDATAGGAWSSSNTAVATVAAGVVTGAGIGTATISYTKGGCSSTIIVTVNTAPTAITGTLTVCNGATTSLNDAVSGGIWTSKNTAVATVVSGAVTGVSVGTDTISYAVGTCAVFAVVTVNPQPTAIGGRLSICNLTLDTLTNTIAGGTWTSATPAVATIVPTTGIVNSLSVGTTLISYTVGTCFATATLTVTALPNAGAITGIDSLCVGSSTTLSDVVLGGTWSSATTAVATVPTTVGIVTGVTAGLDSVLYTVTNSCGTATVAVQVTVNPAASSGAISGTNVICIGGISTLSETVAGGTWSASNGDATVVGGVVTGVAAGVDIISYQYVNSCGTSTATYPVTVNSAAAAAAIAGPATICAGSFAVYSDVVSGGTWGMSNANATVTALTGIVTGVTGGLDTVLYSVTNACGTATATKPITISALPLSSPVTGPTNVCVSSSITLSDALSGGTWHATNATATVGAATGIVAGVSGGLDTIYYSVSNSCGTTNDSLVVTVNPLPNPGTITGSSVVCLGSSITLTDPAAGGNFSASNGNATIGATTGIVTANFVGVDTITYTVINVCGTANTDKIITISPTVSSGSISGVGTVCVASTTTLTNSVSGGSWTATNGNATVGAASGIVTGVMAGLDTINFNIITVCGTATNSTVVTVNPLPSSGTISGASTVCVGSLATLTGSMAGGTWAMTNGRATIGATTGVVIGVAAGMDTVKYTVTNMCGTATVTTTITVNPYPTAGVISGPSVVCPGASITLTETVPGGTWSSGNANATVTASGGIVTGVTGGTDTISYTISNSCGSVGTYQFMTITPAPNPGVISGPSSVCLGSNITLTETVSGGTWSSVSPSIASISAGTVTGLAAGVDTIKYSVTNVCGTLSASYPVTVVTFPTAGTISGPNAVCVGSDITLLDGISGGTWSASNGTATIVAPGVVGGVVIGIDTIVYNVTNACGSANTSTVVTVNPTPVVAAISGASIICVGSSTSLTDATTGGTWSSSTSSVATVGLSSGVVSGVATGTSTITYSVTNSFGCSGTATQLETVSVGSTVPAITGTPSECVYGFTTLSDALSGGTWSSSDNTIATVSGGTVSGVAAGFVTITYAVTSGCGTSYATVSNTVNPLPIVNAIMGTFSGCPGMPNTLTDATPTGTWTSSNTAIAAVGASTGVVTGVAPGNAVINYIVTNSFGCTTAVSASYTVNPAPSVAAITGTTDECLEGFSNLADATVGGTWSSSDTVIATVSTSGKVTGMTGGIVTISYSISNGYGCVGAATVQDTVFTPPSPSPITGTTTICAGTSSTLSDATLYGYWSSSNTTVASIGYASGVATGVGSGTSTIWYVVSNVCGSVIDSVTMTVEAAPTVAPITGATTTVCAGTSTSVSDATPGGIWSVSDTSIATINSATGVITGIAAGSVNVTYTVTNSLGCAGFATYTVTFGSSIGSSFITPSSATLCQGHSAVLNVITSGTGLSYQWYRNGVAIAGATSYSYTADSIGTYSAVVGNGICTETLTGVTVSPAPMAVIGFTAPHELYTGSFATYQWFLNGTPIAGANSSIYNETTPGTYVVVVTDANGCTDTSGTYVVTTGTGVANVNGLGNAIRMYPNPVSTALYIDAPINVNVRVMSPDGKLLIEQSNAKTLDVSSLPGGMYLINVYDESDLLIKTGKFVKM